MQFTIHTTLTLALITVAGAASYLYSQIIHESRDHVPAGWILVRRAERHTVLPLRFELAQVNLDQYLDVSHPGSSNYSKH